MIITSPIDLLPSSQNGRSPTSDLASLRIGASVSFEGNGAARYSVDLTGADLNPACRYSYILAMKAHSNSPLQDGDIIVVIGHQDSLPSLTGFRGREVSVSRYSASASSVGRTDIWNNNYCVLLVSSDYKTSISSISVLVDDPSENYLEWIIGTRTVAVIQPSISMKGRIGYKYRRRQSITGKWHVTRKTPEQVFYSRIDVDGLPHTQDARDLQTAASLEQVGIYPMGLDTGYIDNTEIPWRHPSYMVNASCVNFSGWYGKDNLDVGNVAGGISFAEST